MPKLNREQLFAYQFKLPSIERQRCITSQFKAQLATVEEARQASQVQVKEVEALRWAIYRDLEDKLLKTPKRAQFGKWIASFRNGFGTRPKIGETGPIVLRIADVSSGTIRLDNPRRGEVSRTQAETYKLSSGDLVFVRVNGAKEIVGRCCIVDGTIPPDTIFNDHLIRVQLKAGLSPVFARLAVSLPSARAKIEEAASTSAGQLTINQEILSAILIPILPLDAQGKIATTTESQLTRLKELHQGLQARMIEIDNLPARLLAQAFEDTNHATH